MFVSWGCCANYYRLRNQKPSEMLSGQLALCPSAAATSLTLFSASMLLPQEASSSVWRAAYVFGHGTLATLFLLEESQNPSNHHSVPVFFFFFFFLTYVSIVSNAWVPPSQTLSVHYKCSKTLTSGKHGCRVGFGSVWTIWWDCQKSERKVKKKVKGA